MVPPALSPEEHSKNEKVRTRYSHGDTPLETDSSYTGSHRLKNAKIGKRTARLTGGLIFRQFVRGVAEISSQTKKGRAWGQGTAQIIGVRRF
jgi:hypothetical protein